MDPFKDQILKEKKSAPQFVVNIYRIYYNFPVFIDGVWRLKLNPILMTQSYGLTLLTFINNLHNMPSKVSP